MSDSQNTSLNDNQSKTRRRNQPSNQRIKTRLRIQRKVPQSEHSVPQRRFGQIGGEILPREASMPRLGVNTTHILNPRANMPHPGVIVQPAMSVNAPNDQYEVEANQVADAVMRMPSGDLSAWTRTAPTPPKLQLQNMVTRRRERVQRSQENITPSVTPDVENRISQMDGGGQPLPDETRGFFESRMGADFSGVRVHTDGNAAETSQAIEARAFTSGNNIAFNSGEYNPGTSEGKHLLAHELTHTVQQGAAGQLMRQPLIQRQEETAQTEETKESWHESGNLRGNPPVRDSIGDSGLPNKGIVEDEGIYQASRDVATSFLQSQEARADSLLDEDGNVTDNRYWFARVYQYVTEEELKAASNCTFYYPTSVMRCVHYFEKIYADNFAAADNNGTVEDHWREAFDVAAENDEFDWEDIIGVAVGGILAGSSVAEALKATQSLVASMLAHIRFDLPRAEGWVFTTFYEGMENAQFSDFSPDFMSMAGVFEIAAARMNDEIASKTGVPTDLIPRMFQDWVMRYKEDADMGQERADTWQRAEQLIELGLLRENPYHENAEGEPEGDVTEGDNQSMLNDLPSPLVPEMDEPAKQQTDSEIRDEVSNGNIPLEKRKTSDRIRMIQRLAQGNTFDADEVTILTILKASVQAGDITTVVDGANAWEICYATDGDEFKTLRTLLREHYYPSTALDTAETLIRRCMDGETAEWEEQMVADLLLDRADGRALIEAIGKAYEPNNKKPFTAGLNKIEWQLDLSDQKRVEEQFGRSGRMW